MATYDEPVGHPSRLLAALRALPARQYAGETDGLGTTRFTVVAGNVSFSLLAPASKDQHFTVTGWFPLNGNADHGDIKDVLPFGDDVDPDVLDSVTESARGELLAYVAEAWLALDEQTRHQLTASHVSPWLESVAADAWLAQHTPGRQTRLPCAASTSTSRPRRLAPPRTR